MVFSAKDQCAQPLRTRIAVLVISVLITGCVSQSTVQNRDADASASGSVVVEDTRRAWLDEDERQARMDNLLAKPLGMDRAVQVALLNNPGLQAELAEVDIRAGALRQDAAIANPELHTELYTFGSDSRELYAIETSVEFDLTSVLTRASRLRAATDGIEASRAEAAGRILDFTDEVRRAWIRHVAARHFLEHQQRVNQAAEAAAETAKIYHEAGNLADDELYEIRAFAAEARQALFRAEDEDGQRREELALLLGLPVDGSWSTPTRLASPPKELPSVQKLEEQALERSPLLQQLEWERQRQRQRVAASRWQGWIPALRLGLIADWSQQGTRLGPAFNVGIPMFDRRRYERDSLRARQIQLDFQRQQKVNRIRTSVVRVSRRLEQSHRMARHFDDEILPLGERFVEETLRQYNAMAIGVFDLLDARRTHLQAKADYVEALRDFWLAKADYDHLVGGGTLGDRQAPVGDAPH